MGTEIVIDKNGSRAVEWDRETVGHIWTREVGGVCVTMIGATGFE